MHVEIFIQAIANMGILIAPLIVVFESTHTPDVRLVIACGAVWVLSYLWESVADLQKAS